MRKLSLLLLACLTLGIAWAERVNVTTAQQVAASVAAGLNPSNLRSSSDIKLVYAAPAQSASGLRATGGESDYYIFNVGTDGGFVIVSGEDRVRPVLGYSDEGSVDMERMPENMKAWLSGYQEEIAWAVQQDIATTESVQKEWNEYLSGSSAMGTPVVSLKTAQWAQGYPYNEQTPTINDKHTVTGCVATAMAIIMEYHQYPDKPLVESSDVTYTVNGERRDETLLYNDTQYNWELMRNTDYNDWDFNDPEAANAVAELMWHCGANASMNYGLGESGAVFVNGMNAFRNVFGYKAVKHLNKSDFTWSEWTQRVKDELNQNRPVYYDGQDQYSNSGHAFICDGYTTDDYFHINWGWGYRDPSYYDDYYLLTCLDAEGTNWDFSRDCGMMVDLYPTDEQPTTELRFSDLICQFPIVENVPFEIECTFWNIGGLSFVGSAAMGIIDRSGNLKEIMAEYVLAPEDDPIQENWGRGTTFRCTLSEPLGEGEMIVPICRSVSGEWQILKGDEESPAGIGMDGYVEREEVEEPAQPITWTFMPKEGLTFPGDAEDWFSLEATNIPTEYIGQAPTISFRIEGSLSNEVEVDYLFFGGGEIYNPLEVTVHPDKPTANLCITEPYTLAPLEEGITRYQFAFRYKGGYNNGQPETGRIQIESVTVNGVSLPFDRNEDIQYTVTEPILPIEVAGCEVLYDESHAGKTVNVYSDGIYVVNEPNASIKDLHIQPGGQVRLLQQLEVGQLYLSHDIPTDKWTTFAVPQSSQNIMIGDGHDEILAEGSLMAGRKGYTSADDQLWTPQYEASFVPGTAVLLANANGGGLVGFHNEEFYNETLTPMTLPVRPYTEIDGNQPNGTWFHFVANPLWENLQINGRAYVLDETGLNFALRESPTIKPFEAYMIASDEVMDNVSNLRIGGIPTSNEEMMATGFRAWSESGHICFETTEAKDVAIYSMTGVQLQRIERSVGTKRVALNQGIYIVVCDGTAYKVSVK